MDGQEVLHDSLPDLRAVWEDTSFQLELLQANELCVKQERDGLSKRTQPYFKLTFDPSETSPISQLGRIGTSNKHFVLSLKQLSLWVVFVMKSSLTFVCVFLSAAAPPRVAVVREEGSNGDREMSVSLYIAGFEVLKRLYEQSVKAVLIVFMI